MMRKMEKGDVIRCRNRTSDYSWWFVYGEPLRDDSCHTKNSVFVYGNLPPGFSGEWSLTSWDDVTIRAQQAEIVPHHKIPDEVWSRIGVWGLTQRVSDDA